MKATGPINGLAETSPQARVMALCPLFRGHPQWQSPPALGFQIRPPALASEEERKHAFWPGRVPAVPTPTAPANDQESIYLPG